MKVAFREVSDDTEYPNVDMMHLFDNGTYFMSVSDGFSVVSPTPVWPES